MLKLLLISGDYPPNNTGDANHVFFVARHLANRGIEVQVLTSAIAGIPHCPGVQVFPEMRNWSWSSLPRFARFVRNCRPDAVLQIFDQFGRMYAYQPMMTFAPTVTKKLIPSARFVTQFETPYGIRTRQLSFLTRVLRRGMKRWSRLGPGYHPYGTLLRDSDHIIVLSEAHRTELIAEYPALSVKSSLIPPPPLITVCSDTGPIARARGRALMGAKEGEFLFAFFGYIYQGKGIETLLYAFREVASRLPQVRLVLIGGYNSDLFNPEGSTKNKQYWEEIQRLPRDLGIANRVMWTGNYNAEDDRASLLLGGVDACVLPLDQGIHLNNSSVAVAAGHSLPIIATRAA
ncbi:MAG TPA: glycosyltransferase family 4 protein, partial [Gemmataceae bacterium]|nr:glycosyltransferase family 4 protein [Gemmataceae bacterium]